MKSQIPDFTMMPWILKQAGQDFLAHAPDGRSASLRIGTHDFYFNEKTGEMGVNIVSLTDNRLICKTWEKKLFCGGKESVLYYIGLYSNGNWKVYRLRQQQITAEIRKNDFGKILGAEIFFTLITEKTICFFLPIEIIDAH